jgi:hypothetical protein
MTHDDRNPLSGMRSPVPPEELRETVLSAAREALAAEAKRTIWDRIWESRALRLAWTGTTAALVLGHVLVTIEPEGSGAVPAPDLARAGRETDDLREIVRLPRVTRVAVDFDDAPRKAPASTGSVARSMNGGQS